MTDEASERIWVDGLRPFLRADIAAAQARAAWEAGRDAAKAEARKAFGLVIGDGAMTATIFVEDCIRALQPPSEFQAPPPPPTPPSPSTGPLRGAVSVSEERLRAALKDMLEAVCGPDGFAESVRMHANVAYPWPALELAEEKARAALEAALNGEG